MTVPLARRKSRIVKNRSSTVPISAVRSAAPSVIGISSGARGRRGRFSEILDPGPKLDFPGPGAAVLAVQLQVGLGDRIGVEQPIGAALVGARIARLPDAAIDDDVPDMDVVRL